MKKGAMCLTVAAVLNILLIIGTATFFSSCGAKDDGSFMHCHTACRMVQLVTAMMIVADLIGVFLRNEKIKKIIMIIQIAAAAVAMFIPGKIISLCMMPQMHCRMLMRPFVIAMEVLILLAAVVGLFVRNKEERHE